MSPRSFFSRHLLKVFLPIFLIISTVCADESSDETIGKLETLKSIRMENNLISGDIPEAFASLPTLEVLRVDHNHLSNKVPKSLLEREKTIQVFNISDQET